MPVPIEHLPAHWQPSAKRLRAWLRTDAGIMLILAGFFLTRAGAGVAGGRAPLQAHLLEQMMPAWTLTAVWIVIGALLSWAAFHEDARWSRWVLAVAVGWCAGWAAFTLLASTRNFEVFGAAHACIALLVMHSVWKGRSGEIRVRGDGINGKWA